MIESITYSLKTNNSPVYYITIRKFTDSILKYSEDSLLPIVQDFKEYLTKYKLEQVRETEEYILELISFGVLWKAYAKTALSVRYAPFITLTKMGEWRKKHQKLKPYIDIIRGIFISLFLLPRTSNNKELPIATLEQVDHVCKWFEATGEFREEALRFIRWRAYWGTMSPEELLKTFTKIREFTTWFESVSNGELDTYTSHVDNFLQKSSSRYYWREDRISCMRSRNEYHLNMVGAELMNRAFRTEFKNTQSKVVLLPGCMRGHSQEECKAARYPEGLICEGCLPSCHVNQIREMGKKHNFKVYIIPHASDLSLWSPKKNEPSIGVIASACVTTLVEGGWELKRYDVPTQCVLLDYSGCKKHWHCCGISTTLDIRELKRILN
jgi:uncharacterized protein